MDLELVLLDGMLEKVDLELVLLDGMVERVDLELVLLDGCHLSSLQGVGEVSLEEFEETVSPEQILVAFIVLRQNLIQWACSYILFSGLAVLAKTEFCFADLRSKALG